jgi:hypothetical protein
VRPASHEVRLGIAAAALVLALFAARCPAATRYVDPTAGSDSNDGSSVEEAFLTLAKARSVVNPGDTVNLLSGNYGAVTYGAGERAGTAGNWITYQSYPDANDANFASILVNKAGSAMYLQFKDLSIHTKTGGYGNYCVETRNTCSDVNFVNCKIRGNSGAGRPGSGSYVVWITGGVQRIQVKDCEISYGGFGIQIESQFNPPVETQDVLIHGCHVHDIFESGIKTGAGSDITIEYCRVHDQREDWAAGSHGSGLSIHTHDTTIRGNVVYNYGNTRPLTLYWQIAGPTGYHDVLIENNVVFKTPDYTRSCQWVDLTDVGDGVVLRNNTFERPCIIYFASGVADGSGLSLYNNVFAGGLNLSNYGSSSQLMQQSRVVALAKWSTVNEDRNLYKGLSSYGCIYSCACTPADFSADSNSILDANDAYWAEGTFFQSVSGDYPYQLAEESPAVDFGLYTPSATIDLFELPRGIHPDAGAYELGGLPPAPYPPATPFPGDVATGQPRSMTLRWVDPNSMSTLFDVYLGTDPDALVKISNDQLTRTCPTGFLGYGNTYYWQVVSDDVTEGPVWSFTVKARPLWQWFGGF